MSNSEYKNSLGQPIGFPVPQWQAATPLSREVMVGRYCRLEPLSVEHHARDLYAAYAQDKEDRIWTYLPDGPFQNYRDFQKWMERYTHSDEWLFYAVCEPSGNHASGVACFLRARPEIGTVEVGYINYAPCLQKTRAATEAMYLMMRRAFDELGYRRYEWKCDALNEPSRKAAERLGFKFEGVFRQAIMYKGRNRDTAWYSIIDSEWPDLRTAFESWLDPHNFCPRGNQQKHLAQFMP